ncbi:uncharacterized protein [Neodiprion pinetum]|uniref:Uncharacterized protein LOC107219678 isoform X1 n=1 Tax=Neodiprion lecontei TaxID=441921 RepID=A0ABM3FHX4_NEOLC|nr:uncharacterized protein LOC124212059 isoform X1 [Neodiprion pinetum]XP_046587624.1 uncharacterized protein LOC107219678 isoform X1 [Neodiprion lecontei]
MAERSDRSQLPPGWECRYDVRSGKAYYINHFNKTTSWEDPRVRYWQYAQYSQAQNSASPSPATSTTLPESIPMQSGGSGGAGSYLGYAGTHRVPQVYPTPSPYRNPQPAFLSPGVQEFKTPISSRPMSAMTNRLGELTINSTTPVRNMETNLNQNVDTEVQVARINAMFPTVSDTHIRLLLKKYHNRAAVVVSALQVEKHPLCAPGPCTPVAVHAPNAIPRWRLPAHAIHAALTLSPPRGGRQPPHSPKMKLRYLKNVFPKADETILLDILEQSDNNVQKASEKLIELGYEKRSPTGPSKPSLKKQTDEQNRTEQSVPTPPPRMRSLEEKNKMKTRLMDKYKAVPDKVIMLAMDSVDYDEERAIHILDIMVAEEATQTPRTSSGHSNRSDEQKSSAPITEAIKLTASPIKQMKYPNVEKTKRSKNRIDTPKMLKNSCRISRGTSTTEDKEYKSPYLTRPTGPNPDFRKGPNDNFLLADYMPWAGPDAALLISETSRSLAVGPNRALVTGSCAKGVGPNSAFSKGPIRGLAQGSIYSQRNAANTESRGK